MKKLIVLSSFLVFLASACESTGEIVIYEKILVSIVYTYSTSNTAGEANVALSQSSKNINEVGVVWATKSNPTIADNRESLKHDSNSQSYALKLNNLSSGITYYIRAYYILEGTITYSTDELVFTQNYDPNWINVPSPTIDTDNYVLSSGGVFSFNTSGFVYFSVNKNTNIAKSLFFYPGSDQWQFRNSNSDFDKDAPMRFEPFRADFTLGGGINATLAGGGYYKQQDGNKFFLRDFKVEGVSGYYWLPSYPGTNVNTTAFGIVGDGYILENTANGRLWRYSMQTFQWENRNTVPISKEAYFISFDIGERAFVLPESADWNDDLDALYEYLPTNEWKKITTFKGENRRRGVAFTHNGRLYYGAGQSTKTLKGLRDIWEYNPTTDVWRQIANYPGSGTLNLVTLVVGDNLYIGFGQQVIPNPLKGETLNDVNDFWRFTIR